MRRNKDSVELGPFVLNRRLRQVADLMADGLSFAMIGDRMGGISVGTVRTYAKRLYVRCGVHTRAEVMAIIHAERLAAADAKLTFAKQPAPAPHTRAWYGAQPPVTESEIQSVEYAAREAINHETREILTLTASRLRDLRDRQRTGVDVGGDRVPLETDAF